jgi:hypothetical protein
MVLDFTYKYACTFCCASTCVPFLWSLASAPLLMAPKTSSIRPKLSMHAWAHSTYVSEKSQRDRSRAMDSDSNWVSSLWRSAGRKRNVLYFLSDRDNGPSLYLAAVSGRLFRCTTTSILPRSRRQTHMVAAALSAHASDACRSPYLMLSWYPNNFICIQIYAISRHIGLFHPFFFA